MYDMGLEGADFDKLLKTGGGGDKNTESELCLLNVLHFGRNKGARHCVCSVFYGNANSCVLCDEIYALTLLYFYFTGHSPNRAAYNQYNQYKSDTSTGHNKQQHHVPLTYHSEAEIAAENELREKTMSNSRNNSFTCEYWSI